MMKQHYFFDLDNTITESRCVIDNQTKKTLQELNKDIIVISGAETDRMLLQLDGLDCEIMAQSGAETDYWVDVIHDKQIAEVEKYYNLLSKHFKEYDFYLENRGCQITIGLVKPYIDIEIKKNIDPFKYHRQAMLKIFPFKSTTGLEVKIAGTTSLDFVKTDSNKGRNIEKFINHKGWNKEDCVYYGDSLEEGGNDASVVGVIDTIPVLNPQDLCVKLKQ